jgi:hypothetical protein
MPGPEKTEERSENRSSKVAALTQQSAVRIGTPGHQVIEISMPNCG